jgi:hypothetical protein
MDIGYFVNQAPCWGWSATFVHLERRGFWPFRYTVPLYEFSLHQDHPLTYVDHRGRQWRPDQHRYTYDGGTIPPPFRWMKNYNALSYPRSYAYHDSAWDETTDVPGFEGECLHGLWMLDPAFKDSDWHFVQMTRNETNLLMRDMLLVEGASEAQAKAIYLAVERFGRRW